MFWNMIKEVQDSLPAKVGVKVEAELRSRYGIYADFILAFYI
jgi:hypothetical protein